MLSNRGLNYPFTAIVGQEKVKKALLTILVDPTISGVLIIGPKGSGKTIIARSIVDLLPEIEIVEGCTFHCNPYKVEEMCNQCKEKITNGEKIEIAKMKMPFVELPISATEDRVVGSIDWEKAIREGVKAFQPGLLAQANRGILYIDQVNILPDSLIDVILDASASGWNVVEREGIKLVHPARFTLIGTINPEEGTLRPQILDRFALCVKMEDITDVERRNTIAIRNMLFEEDPLKFIEEWKEKQIEVKKKIEEARKILKILLRWRKSGDFYLISPELIDRIYPNPNFLELDFIIDRNKRLELWKEANEKLIEREFLLYGEETLVDMLKKLGILVEQS
ncbi:MAG: ATP-binding protein [Candidatus Anstonellales archaeon]